MRQTAQRDYEWSRRSTDNLVRRRARRFTPASTGRTPPKQVLEPDSPAVMTSRFEPKDTAAAFSALERLVKTPNVHIFGGSIDVNGGRSEADFLTFRLGRDVRLASDLDRG